MPVFSPGESHEGFLPGESHGQRSLAGYSPQDHAESDTTEATYHTRTSQKKIIKSRVTLLGDQEQVTAKLNSCHDLKE